MGNNELQPLDDYELLPPDRHPVMVYLSSLTSKSSRATMESSARVLSDMLGFDNYMDVPWHKLEYSHTMLIRTQLGEKYSARTTNRYLSFLRGVLKHAYKLGLINVDEYNRVSDLPNFKVYDEPTGRMVTEEEINLLFQTCFDKFSNLDRRDASVMALLFGCGLRRAEVASLQMQNYERGTGRIIVTGKGRKKRDVYVSGNKKKVFDAWLSVRGSSSGWIFGKVLKSGRIDVSNGITSQTVYNIIKVRSRKAGIDPITSHDPRRTFISNLLEKVDITTVAALAGHSDVKTTSRYDRRPESVKKEAASMYDLPLSFDDEG